MCQKAAKHGPEVSNQEAKKFFETWFNLYQVKENGETTGLFTGYYEPQLFGSREKSRRYKHPLYMRPPDLINVNLGRFRKAWVGRSISGKLVGDMLVPYPARKEIEKGILSGRALELFWVDDEIDKFFLHIQGSGKITLDTGEVVRVGFAGRNGQPYFAIGRDLVATGQIEKENVSLQTIRRWLKGNPRKAQALMNKNRSYVFFRETEKQRLHDPLRNLGPVGASGVQLTPERSVAIDRKYYSMGTPIWIQTRYPETKKPLNRLFIAQDTGGAIIGPVRGDLFWGAGTRARRIAGQMKEPGQLFVLLPRPSS